MTKILKINLVAFMQGLTLLIVAFVLTAFFTVLSVVITPLVYLIRLKAQTGLNQLGAWFKLIAISLDQFANVTTATILNATLSKPGAHKYGGEDDTISYILGRNKYSGKLTIFGKFIVLLLHLIERNHVEKAIESKIKQDEQAAHRLQKDSYYQ